MVVLSCSQLEAALTPEMLERLRELESFRDYEARVKAEANTEAEAKVARAEASAEARVKAADLRDFLVIRGDKPSKHALEIISDCHDAGELDGWLKRAYLGETSAQLFPEPEDPAPPAV
jgi:hypothetical protein